LVTSSMEDQMSDVYQSLARNERPPGSAGEAVAV
jgi:hypothetical protein